MKNELLESIIEAQKDRNGKLVDLVNRFKPLMNKYAYRLGYEDAFWDIQLRFIEIILSLNTNRLEALEYTELLTYICACMHNAYISLSKANCQYKELFFPVSEIYEQAEEGKCDDYKELIFSDIKCVLNELEFDVVFKHFFAGIKIDDIATQKGVSRQAVNQIKNRAIKKLRTAFDET